MNIKKCKKCSGNFDFDHEREKYGYFLVISGSRGRMYYCWNCVENAKKDQPNGFDFINNLYTGSIGNE